MKIAIVCHQSDNLVLTAGPVHVDWRIVFNHHSFKTGEKTVLLANIPQN